MSNYKIERQPDTGMFILKAKKRRVVWKTIAYFSTIAAAEERLDQYQQMDEIDPTCNEYLGDKTNG